MEKELEFQSLGDKMFEIEQINEEEEFVIVAKEKDIKEFIKIIENIIVERKSARVQLIKLKNAAGDKLITKS